jgi:hypothetical protein
VTATRAGFISANNRGPRRSGSGAGAPAVARQAGFEPATYGLEGRCSIQLSYWRSPAFQSGRPDSNWRPLAPKATASSGLVWTSGRERPSLRGHSGPFVRPVWTVITPGVTPALLRHESGRPDSNRRPPGPKPGALPDCATSRRSENSKSIGAAPFRQRGTIHRCGCTPGARSPTRHTHPRRHMQDSTGRERRRSRTETAPEWPRPPVRRRAEPGVIEVVTPLSPRPVRLMVV